MNAHLITGAIVLCIGGLFLTAVLKPSIGLPILFGALTLAGLAVIYLAVYMMVTYKPPHFPPPPSHHRKVPYGDQ